MIELKKLIAKGYAKKKPQMWPVYGTGEQLDRTKFVTASEIGRCAREVKFNKLAMLAGGYDPEIGTEVDPSNEWGFFERGHTMEAWVVEMLHAGNENQHVILMTGEYQQSFVYYPQSGTPDGVVMLPEDGVGIIEIKSMDPRTNVKYLPKKAHVLQVLQNLDLVSCTLDKIPIGGKIIYVDASDWKRQFEFKVEWDIEQAAKLEERAAMIMEAKAPADLQPEGMLGMIKDGCKFCNFTAQCSALVSEGNMGNATSKHSEVGTKLFGTGQRKADDGGKS